MRICSLALGTLGILLASSCATTNVGFLDSRFVGEGESYDIEHAYATSDKQAKWLLMSPNWSLENYEYDRSGRPRTAKTLGIYRDKIDWVGDRGGSNEIIER